MKAKRMVYFVAVVFSIFSGGGVLPRFHGRFEKG